MNNARRQWSCHCCAMPRQVVHSQTKKNRKFFVFIFPSSCSTPFNLFLLNTTSTRYMYVSLSLFRLLTLSHFYIHQRRLFAILRFVLEHEACIYHVISLSFHQLRETLHNNSSNNSTLNFPVTRLFHLFFILFFFFSSLCSHSSIYATVGRKGLD